MEEYWVSVADEMPGYDLESFLFTDGEEVYKGSLWDSCGRDECDYLLFGLSKEDVPERLWRNDERGERVDNVTHWMPLPHLPQ